MPLFPIPVEQFGGLDLLNDPAEIGFSGAIDIQDIDLDRPGVIRERDHYAALVANTSLTGPVVLNWPTRGTLASTAASLKLYDLFGAAVGTAVAPNIYYPSGVAAFGTPTTSYLYLADHANTNAIRRLTTAGVISAPAGMPTAKYLTRTPVDNRLVAACVSGNTSRVQFSNPGDAETWGANNYVDLDPGDGEDIQGACTWRDLTFVFKVSKFYVFYGNSTDSTGNAVFNYRAIRNVVGAFDSGNGSAIGVAPDGIYFVGIGPNGWGVQHTSGGAPVHISSAIDPCLNGYAPSFFTPGNINGGIVSATYAGGRFSFVPVDNFGAGPYIFHYTPSGWTIDYTAAGAVNLAPSPYGNLLLVTTDAVNAPIHRRIPGNTATDSLRTPTGRYQSGFDNLAPPRRFAAHYLFGNTRKRFRKWKITGTGSVTFGIAHDMGAVTTTQALTLGTSPAIKDAWFNKAVRGQLISFRFSSTAPFSVNKLTAYLAGSEPPLLGNPSDE